MENSMKIPWKTSNKSIISSVQSLSRVWLFATPWTAACQASLSITNSRSLLKLISIESVIPSNHLILHHPLLLLPSIFPSIGSFQINQFSASGSQSIGPSASVLPMNIRPFQSILVHWFLKCQCSLLPSPFWPLLIYHWFMDLTFQVPM